MNARSSWFSLSRHDGEPTPTPTPDPQPTQPPATGDKDWQAEAEKWKALSRKNEEQAKANADAAKKLADIEAAQQTDAEKLTAAKDAAEKRAAEAIARAVRSEVKALAEGFADREDAVLNLGDLSRYIKDGEVDAEAIGTALKDVLDRKPHLAKAPAGPRNPAPDPSQGRGGDNGPTDFRTTDSAGFAQELAKFGLRPRSS